MKPLMTSLPPAPPLTKVNDVGPLGGEDAGAACTPLHEVAPPAGDDHVRPTAGVDDVGDGRTAEDRGDAAARHDRVVESAGGDEVGAAAAIEQCTRAAGLASAARMTTIRGHRRSRAQRRRARPGPSRALIGRYATFLTARGRSSERDLHAQRGRRKASVPTRVLVGPVSGAQKRQLLLNPSGESTRRV